MEDRFDAVMKRPVLVEDRGAIEQSDAAYGLSQDGVVVGCGGQGADEREQRVASVAVADVENLSALYAAFIRDFFA